MIPKIIHYIWLGKGQKPKIFEKCFKSWQKFCPDYQIKCWDESNLDLSKYKYAQDAYEAKKYAFASDVLRYDILYKEGGIYLDIDVELTKSLDSLLNQQLFMGFETSDSINPGLICGAQKGSTIISEILEIYKNKDYQISRANSETVCTITSNVLKTHGVKLENKFQNLEEITIYPTEYFCPINYTTGKKHITKNTMAIHHYAATWLSSGQKFKLKIKQIAKRILGEKCYNKIKKLKNK